MEEDGGKKGTELKDQAKAKEQEKESFGKERRIKLKSDSPPYHGQALLDRQGKLSRV